MTKVYCVFTDYGHEGKDLDMIFMNEIDADAYIEKNKGYWNFVKEVWEVK